MTPPNPIPLRGHHYLWLADIKDMLDDLESRGKLDQFPEVFKREFLMQMDKYRAHEVVLVRGPDYICENCFHYNAWTGCANQGMAAYGSPEQLISISDDATQGIHRLERIKNLEQVLALGCDLR